MIAGFVQLANSIPLAAQRILDRDKRPRPKHASEDEHRLTTGPEADPIGPTGKVFLFPADPGEHCLTDFEPGGDAVQIDLTGAQNDLYFDTVEKADGAALAISVSDEEVLTLRFPNLTAVPSRDVVLKLSGIKGETVDVVLTDITFLQAEMEAAAAQGRTPAYRKAA